jgi:hypothetical protein
LANLTRQPLDLSLAQLPVTLVFKHPKQVQVTSWQLQLGVTTIQNDCVLRATCVWANSSQLFNTLNMASWQMLKLKALHGHAIQAQFAQQTERGSHVALEKKVSKMLGNIVWICGNSEQCIRVDD